jgi:hypothetical protein
VLLLGRGQICQAQFLAFRDAAATAAHVVTTTDRAVRVVAAGAALFLPADQLAGAAVAHILFLVKVCTAFKVTMRKSGDEKKQGNC